MCCIIVFVGLTYGQYTPNMNAYPPGKNTAFSVHGVGTSKTGTDF